MEINTLAKINVGRIDFINCLPFNYGLFNDGFKKGLISYPTEINQALLRGELDVAPISSIEYLNHQDDLLLLPDVCIASDKFACSVTLLSRVKIEDLDGETIAITEQSASSVILLKLLLKEKYGLKNEFCVMPSNPSEMFREHKAALLIGNDALFCRPKSMVYKYDLGELWNHWQELPFVFAVWAVRREFASVNSESVEAFARKLKENTFENLRNLREVIQSQFQFHPETEQFAEIYSYIHTLRYDFHDKMRAGLERYFDLSHRAGFSKSPQPLEFYAND